MWPTRTNARVAPHNGHGAPVSAWNGHTDGPSSTAATGSSAPATKGAAAAVLTRRSKRDSLPRMPLTDADRIRNVALVGHRGAGKTSLHEALLFEAGVTTRLGSVADGTTVSDSDPDEQARQMSISATLNSFEWQRSEERRVGKECGAR